MPNRALSWLAVGAVACWGLGHAATGHAAEILTLGHDGHTWTQYEPVPLYPTTTPGPRAAAAARAQVGRSNILAQLTRLRRHRAISSTSYRRYVASLRAAQGADERLSGTRADELGAVIGNLRQMTAAGMLTPARLPALFLTLDRNRQWWTTGPIPNDRQIVNFAGSGIDWEYYPGQGIELQVLASFGKASWFFTNGSRYYERGIRLLSELIPLAARRAGGLTWEYYFNFDGGAPPWASAMSQGTALQALADAYEAVGNRSYLLTARHALPVFTISPSRGVAVPTPLGVRFVEYSFDPARGDEVINAFLQTLIGLYEYAKAGGNPLAWRLFREGNAEAEAEVPSYDTGSWSLYQPGEADPLSYHELVTGFLEQLCSLTHARVYCVTAAHFRAYLKHPPPFLGQ